MFLPVQVLVAIAAAFFGGYGMGGSEYAPTVAVIALFAAVNLQILHEVWCILPKEKARR
jgi:hypothetical protein